MMASEQQETTRATIMDDSEKRKKVLIIGGSVLAAVVVLVVIIVVLVLTLGGRQTCRLADQPPQVNHFKPIASEGKLALVRFAGHLKLWTIDGNDTSENKYLDLDLDRVRYFVDSEGGRHLTLDTNCAQIEFQISLLNSDIELKFTVQTIEVTSKTSHTNFERCHVYSGDIQFGLYDYWSCPRRKVYHCYVPDHDTSLIKEKETYAEFVFSHLEFEIDGDPDAIADGHFDKLEKTCKD